MIDVKNLPEKLNFSEAENVYLDDCNFSRTKEMIFGKTKKLDLSGASCLPARLDLSEVDTIVCDECDFESVKTIYVKENEHSVIIKDGRNYADVDVFVGPKKEPVNLYNIPFWWSN